MLVRLLTTIALGPLVTRADRIAVEVPKGPFLGLERLFIEIRRAMAGRY